MKKIGLVVGLILVIAGVGGYFYLNQGHRDVYNTEADLKVESSEIVNEFLNNSTAANTKYLSSDGNSKIVEVSGTVSDISEDIEGHVLLLIKDEDEDEEAGVNCKMLKDYSAASKKLSIGKKVTIKGVVRAGAYYDEDLEMYDHVILDECSIAQ
jgi:hypothetical protein